MANDSFEFFVDMPTSVGKMPTVVGCTREAMKAMSRELPPLSDAQLEIMNLVWDRDEVTVAQVWKTLAARRQIARNTVQTLLARLEEKGWLTHRREGNAFFYSACVPREATRKELVERLLATAFEGSAEGLVMTLLSQRGVTKAEADRIRAMIDQAEKPKS